MKSSARYDHEQQARNLTKAERRGTTASNWATEAKTDLDEDNSEQSFNGSVAEFVGQNGAFRQQAGESVTRGDRRRRELEARSSSPPLACLLPECLAASGGNQWSDAGGLNHAVTH
jgi:hypothetical protein